MAKALEGYDMWVEDAKTRTQRSSITSNTTTTKRTRPPWHPEWIELTQKEVR